MPGIAAPPTVRGKRKREGIDSKATKRPRHDPSAVSAHTDEDLYSRIARLQEAINESRKNYNNITTLLDYARNVEGVSEENMVAVDALFRVFCRLMASRSMIKSPGLSDDETTIVQWLKERYQEFKDVTFQLFEKADAAGQHILVTLILRLLKKEKTSLSTSNDAVWRTGLFPRLVRALVADTTADEVRQRFVQEHLNIYHDVRFYTFECLADITGPKSAEIDLPNTISLLAMINTIAFSEDGLEGFFVDPPSKKHDLYSLTAHKKQAQKAWMAVLRKNLSKAQRKTVLEVMTHRIAPWFLKIELLMDFLTDAFNIGGSSSLMALSGLFYLIQHKNLDYPQFYQKLYSLLDHQILHSKHRSRFFRLLDTFLASTHLPAAMVASFIKRLSRLALHAPASAIVTVVPWIYNLLKNHPSCTFMIHRNGDVGHDETGWGDPFLMDESDPMETDALESSLWEIHALQTHYHPNVATIAKIISEQFTKHAYNIEDFLDHSYATMLDAELIKDMKKPPEIEYEIPKRIFLKNESASGKDDSLLVKLWDFS